MIQLIVTKWIIKSCNCIPYVQDGRGKLFKNTQIENYNVKDKNYTIKDEQHIRHCRKKINGLENIVIEIIQNETHMINDN